MSDLLKGLSAGSWGGFFAWVAPNAIIIALLWLLVYSPMLDAPFGNELKQLQTGELAVVLLSIAAAIGVVESASSTPLYRLLEGYAWPGPLQRLRKKRHISKRNGLLEKSKAAKDGWEKGLLLEKLARYPANDAQVVPTRLGNAIRAFETYGKARYNLDTLTMWSELYSVAPKTLQKEVDSARSIVDFFVAFFYGLLGLAAAALICAPYERDVLWSRMLAAVCLLAAWGAYEMAIQSCSYWRAAMQALVNIGRVSLAQSLGLDLPSKLALEKEMWGSVTSYVYYGDMVVGGRLDEFRSIPKQAEQAE